MARCHHQGVCSSSVHVHYASTYLLGVVPCKQLKHHWLHHFFLIFLAAPQHIELPGQGSDLSCICNLHCSCGNTRSLTPCARPGIKSMSECCRDATYPVVLQRELPLHHFFFFVFCITTFLISRHACCEGRVF